MEGVLDADLAEIFPVGLHLVEVERQNLVVMERFLVVVGE